MGKLCSMTYRILFINAHEVNPGKSKLEHKIE